MQKLIKKKGEVLNLFLGIALSKLGKFEEAIIIYDLALKINPNAADLYLNKAAAFLELGKPVEADIMFGNALNINPKKIITFWTDIHDNYIQQKCIDFAAAVIGNNIQR
ncbi:hypothetical protein pb186bvf_020758 [Paramecium bursaria]